MDNYETPRITELGSLSQLTLGDRMSAIFWTRPFRLGTPFSDLTFSS